jgi:hypothetical protein
VNHGVRSKVIELGAVFLAIVCLSAILGAPLSGQTGGTYQIEKSEVASGGASSGGGYSLESTIGQTIAVGPVQTPPYSAYVGFWVPSFAPTAAHVSVGGRVLTADGRGIRNVRVMLTPMNGAVQYSLTGPFGYYRFDGVAVGETYILTVFSKSFVFRNPTQVVIVNEELIELDFVAMEQ